MALSENVSLADIAAVTRNNGNGGNSDGLGGCGGGGIIAIVLIFVLIAMFGRGGLFGDRNGENNGNGGGNNCCCGHGGGTTVIPYPMMGAIGQQGYDTRADVQRGFDNSAVITKLDGITQGICSLGYDQLNQMNGINQNMSNGFAATTQAINNGFAGVDNAICTLGYNMQQGFNGTNVALMQGQNAISRQIGDCCCETKSAIKDNTTQGMFNMNALQRQISDCCCSNEKLLMQMENNSQRDHCATLQAIDHVGDVTVQAINQMGRQITDYLNAQERQNLRDQNFMYQLNASQLQQNQYLLNQLKPPAVPSYNVPNPNCCNPIGYFNAGCSNSCGGC